jgi:glycosyltransferase involved in cell wall biosynthesis
MSKNTTPVSVVISTRKIDDKYLDHVSKMFSHPKTEIIVFENEGIPLSKIYNEGLEKATSKIVVFMHDDLILETNNLTPKINRIFDDNTEYGIVGVAGTDNLTSGVWWDNREDMYGVVGHIHNGKRYVNHYSEKSYVDNLKEVVTIDGLFMMIHKDRIKHKFNEEFRGFHFYDLPICIENYIDGVKIGVTTKIKLTHKSVGITNKEWERNKLLFEALYEKKLPLKVVS